MDLSEYLLKYPVAFVAVNVPAFVTLNGAEPNVAFPKYIPLVSALNIEFLQGEIQWGFRNEEDKLRDMQSFIGYAPQPLSIIVPIAQSEYSLEGRPWPFDLSCISGECYRGPKTLGPGDKAKLTTSAEDIEDKINFTFLNYVPFIAFETRIPIKDVEVTIPMGNSNQKSLIKDIFNEMGLAAISYMKNK
jgi:hypothetical protein